MPHLEVTRPVANAHVGVGVPFEVRGQAWEVRTLDSPSVDTVTVRVDGGPSVDAALTAVKDKKLALVTFTATVVVAGGDDPHTVTVTAINDIMQSVHVSRLVFAGPSFTPTPPGVVVDLRPSPFAKDSPELARMEAALQLNLLAMKALLGGGNEVVIGPHLLVTEDAQGRSLLRLGLWIEPSTFSAQPPAPPTFLLPRLFPTAIEPSFALAPPQDTPPPIVPAPAFAMSVRMATLQKLLDAIAPQVRAAAADKDVTVETLRVGASGGNGVTTTVSGHVPLGLGFEVSATEFLGLHSVPEADPPQQAPAVVGRDHSSSIGGVLLWLVSRWFPLLRIALVGAWGYVSLQAADTSEQVDGMVAPLLAGLPRRIPFRNNVLPFPGPDFPSLVLHWSTLGVTAAGISGTGATEIVSRDPATPRPRERRGPRRRTPAAPGIAVRGRRRCAVARHHRAGPLRPRPGPAHLERDWRRTGQRTIAPGPARPGSHRRRRLPGPHPPGPRHPHLQPDHHRPRDLRHRPRQGHRRHQHRPGDHQDPQRPHPPTRARLRRHPRTKA
jgi:hypothetical protein